MWRIVCVLKYRNRKGMYLTLLISNWNSSCIINFGWKLLMWKKFQWHDIVVVPTTKDKTAWISGYQKIMHSLEFEVTLALTPFWMKSGLWEVWFMHRFFVNGYTVGLIAFVSHLFREFPRYGHSETRRIVKSAQKCWKFDIWFGTYPSLIWNTWKGKKEKKRKKKGWNKQPILKWNNLYWINNLFMFACVLLHCMGKTWILLWFNCWRAVFSWFWEAAWGCLI